MNLKKINYIELENTTTKPSCDWPIGLDGSARLPCKIFLTRFGGWLQILALNTTFARETISWLNNEMSSQSTGGNWMNTLMWMVFQVQYYDMPRKPGTRIESPDTLGKCWAFA